MPGGGTRTFLEPERYELGLDAAQIQLVQTSPGEFQARLTWAELHRLQLFCCEEHLPRIAFLVLPQHLAFVTFPVSFSRSSAWRGIELRDGDIVLHSLGERLHQVTQGSVTWGVIVLEPAALEDYVQALSGRPLSAAHRGQVLRPASRTNTRPRFKGRRSTSWSPRLGSSAVKSHG
jgi:hypothetical protein